MPQYTCDVCGRNCPRGVRRVYIENILVKCCLKHFLQYEKYGEFTDIIQRNKRDKNEIVILDDYAEIILYDKQYLEVARTKVDIEDIERLINIKWVYGNIKNNCYCEGKINGKTTKMHRYLLGLNINDGLQVDHINHDRLDNRKINLRICTNADNSKNSPLSKNNNSGYIGINWQKNTGKWCVRIQYNGKRINLGYYKNIKDAIFARLKAEKEYYKDFSPQEFLFKDYGL